MLGKPKYKRDELIGFDISIKKGEPPQHFVGRVYIIDAYGTFEQDEEPSYDIMVDNWKDTGERMLVKHVRESSCTKE